MGYNILFLTYYKPNKTKGGTERTTISLATGLKENFNCNCFSAFFISDTNEKESCFEKDMLTSRRKMHKDIPEFIIDNNINIVINQGIFFFYPEVGNYLKKNNTKYLMVHHFQPAWEENHFSSDILINKIKTGQLAEKSKSIIKFLLYPFFKIKWKSDLKKNYRLSYEFADKTILLSSGFINDYAEYSGFTDKSKFAVIPNALSFSNPYNISLYKNKKKKVLIVSRMDEAQKRISHALRLWYEIKKYSGANGWTLDIVGSGPDLPKYKKIVLDNNIPDISFWGRQVPDSFYEESSIFWMTSKSEGFGLTLLEAQQFAVVPVVYNTYATVKDIIENGENGILIEEGNENEFIQESLKLMTNGDYRKKIAETGYSFCNKFSQHNISEMWIELFDSMQQHE